MMFKDLLPGQRFEAVSSQSGVARWQLRNDGRAELLDRHGCVSFIGGRRLLVVFTPETVVTPLTPQAVAVEALF